MKYWHLNAAVKHFKTMQTQANLQNQASLFGLSIPGSECATRIGDNAGDFRE
jgi:hypothetical protein